MSGQMAFGEEGETVGFICSMEQVDDAVRMMTSMLNRFNRADVYIGVDRDGTVLGIDVPDNAPEIVLERIGAKVNHPPKVSVEIGSSDDKRYVHIHAEGYETPYSFGSWFYVRRYRYDENGDIVWVENLTCGMKRH